MCEIVWLIQSRDFRLCWCQPLIGVKVNPSLLSERLNVLEGGPFFSKEESEVVPYLIYEKSQNGYSATKEIQRYWIKPKVLNTDQHHTK